MQNGISKNLIYVQWQPSGRQCWWGLECPVPVFVASLSVILVGKTVVSAGPRNQAHKHVDFLSLGHPLGSKQEETTVRGSHPQPHTSCNKQDKTTS